MNKIRIIDLEILAAHGVLPQEKETVQRFLICAELGLCRPDCTDDIHTTVNYAEVCGIITEFMTANRFELIETIADALCKLLLQCYPMVESAVIEVKKPDAPMSFQFNYVSASAERNRHTVLIGMGSNMGNRQQFLDTALADIGRHKDCRVMNCSGFYDTKAYGKTNQPDFLNAVCKIETALWPRELLRAMQAIEEKAGRVRAEKWGPRTLDLDILFYDDLILHSDDLTIPHPDLQNRKFVLEPMCEIAPDYIHPVFRKAIKEI